MRPKHRKDKNHGRNGWVSGNPRYCRAKANRREDRGERHPPKLKSMGRN
jgi:hypothetical protein